MGLIEQATDTGRRIVGRFDEASANFSQIMRPENVQRIDTALQSLAKSAENLDRTLAQTPALVSDMRRFVTPESAENLRKTAAELAKVSQQLTPTVERWNAAISKVDAAGARIDRLGAQLQVSLVGETLPRINSLATELQGVSSQLSSQLNFVLDDFQRSPQSILVGREAARLGPGERLNESAKENK